MHSSYPPRRVRWTVPLASRRREFRLKLVNRIVGALLTLTVAGCDSGKPDGTPGSDAEGVAPETAGGDAAPTTGASSKAAGIGVGGQGGVPGKEIVLPSGLRYTVVKVGQGASPVIGSAVRFHCTGSLPSGRQFWDTREANVPQREILNYDQLIPGVVQTLLTMKPGERRKVMIPSRLAYGNNGYPHVVPPGTDVNMDLELVSVDSVE